MDDSALKLDDLAREAGVSARTVRYYVQRGLLPAPIFRGRDTVYTRDHLDRLRAIRRLQEQFLPLDAIQAELEQRTSDEVRRLGEGKGAPPAIAQAAEVRHRYVADPAEGWTRIRVAEGLEIHVSERADAMTRALADEMQALARRRGQGGPKQ